MSDLKKIFDAIVPENIKSLPLMKESIDIFLDNLEKHSSVCWDISYLYNTSLNLPDGDLTKKTKTNVRKAFLDIYLNVLNKVIKLAQNDKALQLKYERMGIDSSSLLSLTSEEILGSEFFTTNKQFKETVGTIGNIKQAHSLASTLESGTISKPIIVEKKPFHLVIESKLSAEIYTNLVDPLSHPVGFTYVFRQMIEANLEDLFGLTVTYNVTAIEIRGSNGEFHVFTELTDTANVDTWLDFATRINPSTGKLFTESEFLAQVTIYSNKKVKEIIKVDTVNEKSNYILFTDGSVLSKFNEVLKYVGTSGSVREFIGTNEHFSLYVDSTSTTETNYLDTIDDIIYNWDITGLNDLTAETGNISYLDSAGVPQPIDSSDFIISTSTEYMNSDLIVLPYSVEGLYLASNDSLYFTVTDPLALNGESYITFQPPV